VKRFLGEGARKRVYLAHDTSLASDVAVAAVKTEGLDADGLIRVRREAQAMGRLRDHANIVRVFDIGQDGSQPYIVSQLLEGGSVDDRLREVSGHKLPIVEALRIGLQVAQALEHAHSLGIVHRDLKPGNVWLARDGTAKLGDFGLAVMLDQSLLTQEGMLVGTVAYMPPEQAMGRTPDARSDLYALGAMLYEMVAGRPPFLGDDAVTVIPQHVSTPPVAPSWHNPQVPPALEALVQRLLAKDPAARPQRASDVVSALRHLENAPAETAAAPPATGPADTRRRAAWGRFVGRRQELDQLKEALEDAIGGRSSLAMLVGEPGIGKTRLAEEFTVYARLRGAQVLAGRSYEGAVEVAYFPFVEAFRQYVRARPDADLRRELGDGAPDVANLVSEIRQRFPELPVSPPLQGDAERLRLFGSVTEFLRAATVAGPLVLHLDDLHWADTPSLLLLRHLARHLAGERLLIVGSYRDVELDRMHPLAEVLGTLRRETSFRRVLLRGLPTDDVVAYLTALADEEPDPAVQVARLALAQALHRETEGNPFFIGEVLSHLVESSKLYWDGTHWRANVSSASELGIPEGVREVVGRRLPALSKACNRMLTVASAMPAGFSWEVLRATAEGDEATLLDALEEALAARLVREREGGHATSYEFTHALIRQTLYEELSAPRRVLLALAALQYGGEHYPPVEINAPRVELLERPSRPSGRRRTSSWCACCAGWCSTSGSWTRWQSSSAPTSRPRSRGVSASPACSHRRSLRATSRSVRGSGSRSACSPRASRRSSGCLWCTRGSGRSSRAASRTRSASRTRRSSWPGASSTAAAPCSTPSRSRACGPSGSTACCCPMRTATSSSRTRP
jgi:hypothetical protein